MEKGAWSQTYDPQGLKRITLRVCLPFRAISRGSWTGFVAWPARSYPVFRGGLHHTDEELVEEGGALRRLHRFGPQRRSLTINDVVLAGPSPCAVSCGSKPRAWCVRPLASLQPFRWRIPCLNKRPARSANQLCSAVVPVCGKPQ